MSKPVAEELLEQRRAHRRAARNHQTYRSFLKDVIAETQLPESQAEKATVAILCLLDERLSPNEAHDFEAQIPKELRELLFRCESHEGKLNRKFHRSEMMAELSKELNESIERVEEWTKAIFRVLARRLSAGEVDDVVSQLPKDMRGLWPASVQSQFAQHAAPPETSHATHKSSYSEQQHLAMLEHVDWALSLPIDAQLGFLRTVVPRILADMSEQDRMGFVHTLNEEIQRAKHHDRTYDIRHTHGQAPSPL